MYLLGYFSYTSRVDHFPISTNFYVLQSFPRDIVLGIDVINKLNLAINEDRIKIFKKRNNFHAGYIRIVENFVKKLNYAANSQNEVEISTTNNSHEQKTNIAVINNKNSENNYPINFTRCESR